MNKPPKIIIAPSYAALIGDGNIMNRRSFFGKIGLGIAAIFSGGVVAKNLVAMRRWLFPNPLKQAQSLVLLKQSGHLTQQQVEDELPNGISFEQFVKDLEDEHKIVAIQFMGL